MATNNEELFQAEVISFESKKAQKNEADAQFETEKYGFYQKAETFFSQNESIDGTYYFDSLDLDGNLDESYSVTRVQKIDLDFDIKKLKNAIGKELSSKVIKKTYSIYDMEGLIKYLKSCGVDPSYFKTFITVQEKVDTKAINKLSDIGEISEKQIKGCYTTKAQNPYFVVKKSKAKK